MSMRDASRLTRPQVDRLSLLRRRIEDLRGWARKDFYWWLIVIPILQWLLVAHLSAIGFHEWQNHTVFKSLMEWVHPCILLAFTLIVLQRWRLDRTYTYGWLSILGFTLFCRELHFIGSSITSYTILIIMALIVFRHPDRLRPLFKVRWASSFFAMTWLLYLTSQLIDRGVIKRVGWVLLQNPEWDIPYSSNIEESLESLGGLFLLIMPFFISRNDKQE